MLPAGDYLAYEVESGQPVQVCLRPADGPEACQTIAPTPEQATYFEYRPGQPLLPRPAKAGASALARLAR